MSVSRRPGLYRAGPPTAGDGTGSVRGLGEGWQHDFIGVGEAGFLGAHGADPDALANVVGAFLDHAVLEQP